MGIESDQLVYDYLSRVGDVAQQRQLPAAERMRLVSSLRNEIDRQRGTSGGDSPAAVRRILGRLGEPEEVVGAASSDPGRAESERSQRSERSEPATVPTQRTQRTQRAQLTQWTKKLKGPERPGRPARPGTPEPPGPSAAPAGGAGAGVGTGSATTPPHLAGMDELGPSAGGQPDWWRIEPGPMGAVLSPDAGARGGFVGGVEIPEILKPPPEKPKDAEDEPAKAKAAAEAAPSAETTETAEATKGSSGRRFGLGALLGGLRRKDAGGRPRTTFNALLLLAAALLCVGAVQGSLLALAFGWVLAYASRTLSQAEAKWAVFGLPGVSAVGGLVWFWGRLEGRWGDAIPNGGMADAWSDLWPVVVRTAAVTSALYLVWRARKGKRATG